MVLTISIFVISYFRNPKYARQGTDLMSEYLPNSPDPILLAFDRHERLLVDAAQRRFLYGGTQPPVRPSRRWWGRFCCRTGDLLIGLGMRLKAAAATV